MTFTLLRTATALGLYSALTFGGGMAYVRNVGHPALGTAPARTTAVHASDWSMPGAAPGSATAGWVIVVQPHITIVQMAPKAQETPEPTTEPTAQSTHV